MSVESILESIEKLTLLEAAELVKAMEEKFGVSAAAPVAVAAVAAAPAEAAAEEAKKLASMPSKEELYAKILGSINSPASGIVYGINGVMSALVRAIDAVAKQKAAQ